MKRLLTLALVAITSTLAAGDDTPFLSFNCEYDRALADNDFQIEFKNDGSQEVETWSSKFSQTKMRFEKMTQDMVKVKISTGMPIVSHAMPEEFHFTAPLTGDGFEFSFGMKPFTLKNEFFSLHCKKFVKPN